MTPILRTDTNIALPLIVDYDAIRIGQKNKKDSGVT